MITDAKKLAEFKKKMADISNKGKMNKAKAYDPFVESYSSDEIIEYYNKLVRDIFCIQTIVDAELRKNYTNFFIQIVSKILDNKIIEESLGDVSHYSSLKTILASYLCGIINWPRERSHQDEMLRIQAESDLPILITGQTGTGKELHANLIHLLSKRNDQNFIALNCAGIPDSLLESELFGHVEGAFTGANQSRQGYLEAVGRGTLFLDEIGDMPLHLQAKLLRVLESREFYRVGDSQKPMKFEGRILSATNRNLADVITQDPPRFRPDLYYRLSVFDIYLPSLHEQKKLYDQDTMIIFDIPAAIARIRKSKVHIDSVMTKRAQDCLLAYNYPGNYRELNSIIQSAFVNASTKIYNKDKIDIGDLPEKVQTYTSPSFQKAKTLEDMYRDYVEDINVRDIVDAAEDEAAKIIKCKLTMIYQSGLGLKTALARENVTGSQYNNLWKKIKIRLGNDCIKEFKTTYLKRRK